MCQVSGSSIMHDWKAQTVYFCIPLPSNKRYCVLAISQTTRGPGSHSRGWDFWPLYLLCSAGRELARSCSERGQNQRHDMSIMDPCVYNKDSVLMPNIGPRRNLFIASLTWWIDRQFCKSVDSSCVCIIIADRLMQTSKSNLLMSHRSLDDFLCASPLKPWILAGRSHSHISSSGRRPGSVACR